MVESNAASDFSSTNSLAKPLGENHEESLQAQGLSMLMLVMKWVTPAVPETGLTDPGEDNVMALTTVDHSLSVRAVDDFSSDNEGTRAAGKDVVFTSLPPLDRQRTRSTYRRCLAANHGHSADNVAC